MEYITTREAADKWSIMERRVQVLRKQGKILGEFRLGWAWGLYPKVLANRRTTGKLDIKTRNNYGGSSSQAMLLLIMYCLREATPCQAVCENDLIKYCMDKRSDEIVATLKRA